MGFLFMKNLLNEIFFAVKNSKKVFIISLIIFVLGVVLGVVLSTGESFFCFYVELLVDFIQTVLSKDGFGISYLIKRILTYAVILLIILALSLNRYTFYFIFVILFYRAFTLGFALRLFVTELLINGAMLFLFLVLFQALFFCLSIIVYSCLTYKKLNKINSCTLNYAFRCYLIALIIATIGALVEFLFILTLIRPFNFHF